MTKRNQRLKCLQVSGFAVYDSGAWADGIRSYLQGIRTNDVVISGRPKLSFNNTVLRLGEDGRYYGYVITRSQTGNRPLVRHQDEVIDVGALDYEVEPGLDKFVENTRVRQLTINLPDGSITLTRNPRKPHKVLISAEGLPSQTEVMRRLGYSV